MKKKLNKIILFALILPLTLGTLGVRSTNAYYNDTESSSGNSFTAGSLDIATSSDDLGPVDLGVVKDYRIINQGSLLFEYEMTVGISGGSDTTFCGQLNIIVLKGADTLYTGSLSGLDFTKLLNNGTQDGLTFTITDSHANPAGKVCSFNFVSKAWQDELDYSQGFTDTASTKAVVYSAGTIIPSLSSGVVLNEFLPNPNGFEYGFNFGEDGDSMPRGQWIELYNNSNASVDLTGWYIKDLENNTISITNTNTKPATTTIPAHGWLVVYMNGEILNNTGILETITLYNNLNISQNSYSYDGGTYCDMEPTPNDNNDTNPSGHCSSIPGNKSYARIPDGVGAWVDPIPTPGAANELAPEIIPEKVIPETEPVIEVAIPETKLEEIIEEVAEKPVGEVVVEEPVVVAEPTKPEVTEEVVIEQPTIEESVKAVVEEIVAEIVSVVETPALEPTLEPAGAVEPAIPTE